MELAQQQIQELFKFKILLLGAGESGKSTIVKQLKIVHKEKIHEDGIPIFSSNHFRDCSRSRFESILNLFDLMPELNLVAISLHQNVADCTLSLFDAAEKFGFEISDEAKEFADALRER